MFRKLVKNKKAQSTAEYAILISLVVAGIIAMQTYAQRALQARVRDAAMYLVNGTSDLGNTSQYEPYYLTTNYEITRVSDETQTLSNAQTSIAAASNRTRKLGGSQIFNYVNTVESGI